MDQKRFNRQLAEQCAKAFSASTGLGCFLSDKTGKFLCDYGFSCEQCQLCILGGFKQTDRIETHLYGKTASERFGGKYIYHCPMGLVCIVSPILSDEGLEAKITAGPFLMVDKQEFLEYELSELCQIPEKHREKASKILENILYVEPKRANQLATLLFLAVGFMNNLTTENQMLTQDRSGKLQEQISSYIVKLKQEEISPYPIETEQALLCSIAQRNGQEAQNLLN